MTKKCKPYALVSDPRSAFSTNGTNSERLALAQNFIDAQVKAKVVNLASNPDIDVKSIPAILRNADTLDTWKTQFNDTIQCCDLQTFLASLGAKEPDSLLRQMVANSIKTSVETFENYRNNKEKFTGAAVARTFARKCKGVLSNVDDTMLSQIDAKGRYVPVSSRATLLPPIRPPVSHPQAVAGKMKKTPPMPIIPNPEMLSDEEEEDSVLVEIGDELANDEDDLLTEIGDKFEVGSDDDDLAALPDEEEEDEDATIGTSLRDSSATVAGRKKMHSVSYSKARELLVQNVGLVVDKVPAGVKNFVFVTPSDETIDTLFTILKEKNQTLDEKKIKKLLRTHLLWSPMVGKWRNLSDIGFTADEQMLHDERGKNYKIVHKSSAEKVARLGKVTYLVINDILPPKSPL